MKIVLTIAAILSSIMCLGNTVAKSADRFEKVFFSIMSILFLIVGAGIQIWW